MNGMQSETDERNFTHLHHNSWRERYANSLSMLAALTEPNAGLKVTIFFI